MTVTGSPRNKHRCCVLVPAFNEEGRIGPVVTEIQKYVPDVAVVDDGSSDRTAQEAEQAGAMVVRHSQNQGKGVALNTGFDHMRDAGFDVVITMDADGQHAAADLPAFLEAYVRTGIPVLVGNRMSSAAAMPRVRRVTNMIMSWLLSREMGQYVPDTQCGFRLYRCDVIPFVAAESKRFAAESEILLHIAARGIRIGAVPIATIYTPGRESKIRPVRDTVRFLGMLWKYRRQRRRRLAAASR